MPVGAFFHRSVVRTYVGGCVAGRESEAVESSPMNARLSCRSSGVIARLPVDEKLLGLLIEHTCGAVWDSWMVE